MSHNAKYYAKSLKRNSEIVWYLLVVKGEKILRGKYSVDTLTDTATVDFGCASSTSQSKKDNVIEVHELINRLLSLCNIVQFS